MKIFYDEDADISIIQKLKVTIVGYGSQGHAHANNLHESGVDVTVALREGSSSWSKAENAGLNVARVSDAVKDADLVMILAPDEFQQGLYETEIKSNLKSNAVLAFAHGFNIHFKKIIPADDTSVIMIAPKGPGHTVRSTYKSGGGVPSLIAIYQDGTNPNNHSAKEIALSYAKANGGTRAGVLETTFKEETETDLFGEQVVLCGGLTELIRNGFETLVEAGYQPESAYFETLHEVKLIVDLMYEGGFEWMRHSISDTAEYGDFSRGSRIITSETKKEMKKVLEEIQSGAFAKEWMSQAREGSPFLNEKRAEASKHQLEEVGKGLREMMPFLNAKDVKKDK